jgi:hypothetical protein
LAGKTGGNDQRIWVLFALLMAVSLAAVFLGRVRVEGEERSRRRRLEEENWHYRNWR